MEEEIIEEQNINPNSNQINKSLTLDFSKSRYVKTKIEAVCYLIWRDMTKRFGLNTVVNEVNPDLYTIQIENIIKLKILQICNHIKIFCSQTPFGKHIDISINLAAFFNLNKGNQITLDDQKIIHTFKNQSLYERMLNILDSRIYLTLNQDFITTQLLSPQRMLIYSLNSKPILFRICRFLNKKDLLKFLTLNFRSTTNFSKNKEFWFTLYSSKFGMTGFKLNQLEWKEVYLKKIK